jgi:hypothetical protein
MSMADDISAFLIAQSVLTAAGTDHWINWMPDVPDAAVALYETAGEAPTLGLGADGVQYENPHLQIVVRGAQDDTQTPLATAVTIMKELAKVQGDRLGSLNGTRYLWIQPIQSPEIVDYDAKGRPVASFNCRVSKEP